MNPNPSFDGDAPPPTRRRKHPLDELVERHSYRSIAAIEDLIRRLFAKAGDRRADGGPGD